MLSPDELDDARADLEDELTDVVTISRRLPDPAVDPDTLEEIEAFDVLYPNEPSLVVSIPSDRGRIVTEGDGQVSLPNYWVTVRVGVTGLRKGDQVTVVDSTDPQSDGRTLTVVRPAHGTVSISRRLLCQEVA